MNPLRDRWHASRLYRFFSDLSPRDRAVVWVLLALALALGVANAALLGKTKPDLSRLAPSVTAPPFELAFA